MADFSRERINRLNTQRLEKVDSVLAGRVLRMVELARADGYELLVTQGFRSIDEQNRLYAQGRTRPGKIVTNARGGQSKHNFGKAVDVAVLVNGEITWAESVYKKTVGKYAAQVGIEWGGNWKKFKDYPHVQI